MYGRGLPKSMAAASLEIAAGEAPIGQHDHDGQPRYHPDEVRGRQRGIREEWVSGPRPARGPGRRDDLGWLQVEDRAVPEPVRRDQEPAHFADTPDGVVGEGLSDRQRDPPDPGHEE